MQIEKTEITYVFGFGRSKLISSTDKFANDFFYGFFKFLTDGNNINYIEFQDNSENPNSKKITSFISKVLRKISKLSFFLENILSLKNFKVLWNTKHIIATNDRIGISLLPFLIIYKLLRVNKTSVIVMGLLAKQTTNIISHISQRILLNIFFSLGSNFIFLSKSECKQAEVSYKKYKDKFHFVPFCVDTSFWMREDERKINRNKILFIGNDGRREYDLVLQIAKAMPQYEFLLITSNIQLSLIESDNVKLIKGSWNKRILSDHQLRDYYHQGLLSIIPIKNTYQPSGQSVALQSMSMKVPVLISDTIGFWDKEMFINNENIFFISDNNLDTWVDRIQKILSDTQLTNMVSLNGNKTAVENYDSEYFYNSLNKIIFNS
jgi:glycosyltransferase involved in cell wall biosynthesis